MDITKYIGQFLLKNNYCYIHGIGNLELAKRPATHDGKSLFAPAYEVILTTGGSIDDSFANFIATNEQISISKAANGLRDFSMQARKELQAGKDVAVEGLGFFREEGGRIRFYTDANFSFTPAGIPVLKNSRQLEEQRNIIPHEPAFPAASKANSINWSMVVIVAVLLVILGAGGFGFYYYKSLQRDTIKPVPLPKRDTVAILPPVVTDTIFSDTTNGAQLKKADTVVDTNAINTYQLLVGDYIRDRAEKQYRRLKINGHHVEMITKDSISYKLIETVNCRIVDTTRVIDSMQRFFGYKGVVIYRQ